MHSARKRREGSVKKSKRRREDEHEDVRDEDVFHDEEPTARDAEAEGDAEAEDTETAASKRLRIGVVLLPRCDSRNLRCSGTHRWLSAATGLQSLRVSAGRAARI